MDLILSNEKKFFELAESLVEENIKLQKLINLANHDFSSQSGFEISNSNIDFLICIDKYILKPGDKINEFINSFSEFVPYEVLEIIKKNYLSFEHIWFEFDQKNNYSFGGFFVNFKKTRILTTNYMNLREFLNITNIGNVENYLLQIKNFLNLIDTYNFDLNEIGYMPGRSGNPIRLCLFSNNNDFSIIQKIIKKTFDEELTLNQELLSLRIEHFSIDIDLFPNKFILNGIEVFPLETKLKKINNFCRKKNINLKNLDSILSPKAIQISSFISDQNQIYSILKRSVSHFKVTYKNKLNNLKIYISMDKNLIKKSTLTQTKKINKSVNQQKLKVKDWNIFFKPSNFDGFNYSIKLHQKRLIKINSQENITSVVKNKLWIIDNFLEQEILDNAYYSVLRSKSWSFSNRGTEKQIYPSWWITNKFPDEVKNISKLLINKFLNVSRDIPTTRLIVNGHTSGFSDQTHNDYSFQNQGLTFLLFLNPNWEIEHDGDFKFYPYEDKYCYSFSPIQGRLIIFDGSFPHRASSVSRDFMSLRLSIALQYSSIYNIDKIIT